MPKAAPRKSTTPQLDSDILVQMLRRELYLALESMDIGVFKMKLNFILESAGEYADLVLMSGFDSEGRTALHIAVETKFEEAVKLLVATGKVDLLATAGNNKWTPLHTAVDLCDANLTQALLQVPPTTPTNLVSQTARKIFRSLRQPTNSAVGVTPLHMAVRRNSALCAVALLEAANRLIEYVRPGTLTSSDDDDDTEDDDSDDGGGDGRQKHQRSDFHGQVGEGSRKLNKLKDKNGDTPLHWAVKTNNYAMARLLCSYGARPRQSHNSQGQTPLVLSKYVLRNSKMTKLLSSFSPTSSPQSKRSTVSTSEDIDAIQNTEEDAVILPVLPESSLNLTAKSSTVDSGAIATRLRRTGVVAAMATKVAALSPRNDAIETMSTSSLPLSSVVDNETIGVSPRPYLHREAKVAFTEVDLAVDPDTLEPPRPRANSLKVCRRELEVLRRKLPAFLTRSSLQKAMVHQPRPVPLRARRKASTMDPSEYYPMASPKRGICVIINNMTYWHPQFRNRGGCDKDEKRVEKVFGDLGFLVKVLRNLSSGEMRSELKFIGRKTDHTAYDCFVAVVMAHGGLGELYGVNGDAFPVHQLTFDFTAEKCPSLAGKPKLFFIQACRGDEYQLGYALPVQSNAEEPPQVVTNPPRVESASNPLYISSGKDDEPAIAAAKLPRKQRLVPSFADFLLSYATLAGFKAQRDAKQGSMYIQTLCHHLEVYGRVRSLLDIVTSVHREVSERVFREADSPEDEGTIFQQTPEVRHTLTRRVQFV